MPSATVNAKEPNGMAMYLHLLKLPHAMRLTVFGVLAQYASPMLGMGIILAIKHTYDSYTLAGAASASSSICFAVSSPLIGRLIDRYGQKRIGIPLISVWTLIVALLMTALYFHAPEWIVLLATSCAGLSVPFGSMLRARWNLIMKNNAEGLNSALSMISVFEELMWATGTPLATAIAALVSPLLSIGLGVFFLVFSGVFFLGSPAYEPIPLSQLGERKSQPAHISIPSSAQDKPHKTIKRMQESEEVISQDQDVPTSPAPLFTVGLVALFAILIGYGAFQSTIALSVIALSEEVGRKEWSGLALACFSTGAMIGALAYGARRWSSPLLKRFYVFLTLLACGCSTLIFTNSLSMAALILLLAGGTHAPTIVNINQLIMRMAPAARLTEAMALLGAMWVIGQSISNLITGHMVDTYGAHGGFTITVSFSIVALFVAALAYRPIRHGYEKSANTMQDGS